MPDPRDLRRTYIKTPQLVQTGTHLPPTPLDANDWDGLRRLLDAIREAVNGTDGLSGSYTIGGTAVVLLQGKIISIS